MITIDKYSRLPIYEQIIERIEALIADGTLVPGQQLPSIRVMSQELSVNPNTLQRAYAELERRGLCRTQQGSGRYITEEAQSLVFSQKRELLKEITRICKELKRCNVAESEVAETVKEAYKEVAND